MEKNAQIKLLHEVYAKDLDYDPFAVIKDFATNYVRCMWHEFILYFHKEDYAIWKSIADISDEITYVSNLTGTKLYNYALEDYLYPWKNVKQLVSQNYLLKKKKAEIAPSELGWFNKYFTGVSYEKIRQYKIESFSHEDYVLLSYFGLKYQIKLDIADMPLNRVNDNILVSFEDNSVSPSNGVLLYNMTLNRATRYMSRLRDFSNKKIESIV